ncbi:helix-turn-helix transcriptional regulator [Oscillospiraceae bacterium 44-5]|nr:helix-turn-helix transcriptional regulator [Oscillospiraceae bacterium]
MADLSIFGQRIKQIRQEMSLSQRDFAEKIGITASALSAYENGLKNPSVNVAILIASTFKVSLDWLCGLKNEETSKDLAESFDMESLFDVISGIAQYEGVLKMLSEDNSLPEYVGKLISSVKPDNSSLSVKLGRLAFDFAHPQQKAPLFRWEGSDHSD